MSEAQEIYSICVDLRTRTKVYRQPFWRIEESDGWFRVFDQDGKLVEEVNEKGVINVRYKA